MLAWSVLCAPVMRGLPLMRGLPVSCAFGYPLLWFSAVLVVLTAIHAPAQVHNRHGGAVL